MFWIVGGREVLLAAVALFVTPVPAWLEYQLDHVPWESYGFSAWDLIMPLFLFVSGVSLPFSMTKWRQTSARQFWLRIGRRILILWILGMAIQGHLLEWDLDRLKLYSNTLQAIAAGYLIAVILTMTLPMVGQIAATAALLIGFWAILNFVPFDGYPAGTIEPWHNVAKYVDQVVLGSFSDTWYYTWVLSSLGFGATLMFGVFAGYVLRSSATPNAKAMRLVALGLAFLLIGGLWSFESPFIKYIWSSSMNMWAGGWCFLLLAAFYWIIDAKGFRRWAFPLVVLGVNAITVYTATHLFDFQLVGDVFVGSLKEPWGAFGMFLSAFGALLVPWLILYYMYRKKTFIRI